MEQFTYAAGTFHENERFLPHSTSRGRPVQWIFSAGLSAATAAALLVAIQLTLSHFDIARDVLFAPPPSTMSSTKVTTPTKNVKINGDLIDLDRPQNVSTPIVPTNTKVETVIERMFVPPNDEDLEFIRQKIFASNSLPPITNEEGDQISERVSSVTSSLISLASEREEIAKAVKRDCDSVDESFNAFVSRWERDIMENSRIRQEDKELSEKVLVENMNFLKLFLKRSSFSDLDGKTLTELVRLAKEDVLWLLGTNIAGENGTANESLLLNIDGALYDAFDVEEEETEEYYEDCPITFLSLDMKPPSPEFTVPSKPPTPTKIKRKKRSIRPAIPEGAARESDLYHLVTEAKNILSRREISSAEIDENGTLRSPLDDAGADAVQSQLESFAKGLQGKRHISENQMEKLMQSWDQKAIDISSNLATAGINERCASTLLVEKMIARGLEALRSKKELRLTLTAEIRNIMSEVGSSDDFTSKLGEKITEIDALVIEFDSKGTTIVSSKIARSSSWKVGRKSVYYTMDGPLLHLGVAGGIDFFTDLISGYNDNLDAFMDWVAGEDGVSLGTSVVSSLSKLIRKIPFPDEYAKRTRKAGVLAGRTRILLE
mmetsp:Transcript_16656/g.34590  ORF Transcript_16656/g.34590 Transcript_16656/m.34590 type:complete len:604 (-) Transcript_16656:48-1859(-)